MTQTLILWPVMALIGWTFLVLLLIPFRRIQAGLAGRLSFEDFRYGESDAVPAAVRLPNRVFINLLEMPVLFYVLAVVLYVTAHVDPVFVGLAWAYVGCRLLHSLIYLSYNRVMHRFLAFVASNLVVVAIWARLILVFARS